MILILYFEILLFQIGELKKGLNPPSATDLVFVSPYIGTAIKTGLITGIIALAVSTTQISFPLCAFIYIFFLLSINYANKVLKTELMII